jgi:hypothetical protein
MGNFCLEIKKYSSKKTGKQLFKQLFIDDKIRKERLNFRLFSAKNKGV